MSEVKQCPFCGGEARVVAGVESWSVMCVEDRCEASPETQWFSAEEDAIAAWNARAERTCKMTLDFEDEDWYCSECGSFTQAFNKPNYCAYCGAKVVDDD